MAMAAAACGGKEFTPAAGSAGMPASGGSAGGGTGGSAGSADLTPPADVGGEYLVAITNGTNTCSTVSGWTEGQQSTDIPVTLVQDGTMLTGEAGGLAALTVVLLTGENSFVGEIHGNEFSLTNYGTKASTAGNCTYTVNAVISGTVHGNSIEGTITYKPAISDNPDCAPYDCQADQAYSGSRPPPA